MYGDIVDTLISVLRASTIAKAENMSVCVCPDEDDEGVVNMPVPSISVNIDDSPNATVYIGGAIQDKLNITISVMVDLSNYSWSKDGGLQAKILSFARGIRNAIETAKADGSFQTLKQKYCFWPLYQGFKTYRRLALKNLQKRYVLDVQLKYQSVVLDKELSDSLHSKVDITSVELTCQAGLTTILPHPPYAYQQFAVQRGAAFLTNDLRPVYVSK